MTTPPDQFEQSLLTELRAHVAERSANRPARATGRRLRLPLAASAVVAAAISATVLTGPTVSPSSAFTVETQADGGVVVTVHDLRDADGLEHALAAEGVEAEVTYDNTMITPDGTGREDDDPMPSTVPPLDQCDFRVDITDDAAVFQLSSAVVDSDNVLHIFTAGDPSDSYPLGGVGIHLDGLGDFDFVCGR
jgi:hypothetical protein